MTMSIFNYLFFISVSVVDMGFISECYLLLMQDFLLVDDHLHIYSFFNVKAIAKINFNFHVCKKIHFYQDSSGTKQNIYLIMFEGI